MFQFDAVKVRWVLALGLLAGCRGSSSADPGDNTSSTGDASSRGVAPSTSGDGATSSGSNGGSGEGSTEGTVSSDSSSGASLESSAGSTSSGACDVVLEPLPDELLPRCATETLTCATACGEDDLECIDQCLQDDPTHPDAFSGIDCETCSIVQLLACSDPACHDENAAFVCCTDVCERKGCPENACEAELTAAFECAVFSAGPCLEANAAGTDGCFPSGRDGTR